MNVIQSARKMWWKRFGGLLAAAALTLAFSACNKEDDGGPVTPENVAYVSLYNASPNAPDLNIVVDSRQINTYPFEYGDYTGYLRFFTGNRKLQFGPFNASNVALDTTVSFENGRVYSVFVVDEYTDLSLMVIEETDEEAAEGKAMLRVVHLSPDAPEIDLAMRDETDAVAEGITFMGGTDFLALEPNEYDFEVRLAGDDNVLLNIPDVELQEGWFYTIVVQGYEELPTGNNNVLSAKVIVN